MSDEIKLSTDTSRGAQAEALLRSELLKDAFEALDREYVKAWRATGARDNDARERLFQAVHIVGKVRDHLISIVNNGKLAQAELNDLAEHTKRFGS